MKATTLARLLRRYNLMTYTILGHRLTTATIIHQLAQRCNLLAYNLKSNPVYILTDHDYFLTLLPLYAIWNEPNSNEAAILMSNNLAKETACFLVNWFKESNLLLTPA